MGKLITYLILKYFNISKIEIIETPGLNCSNHIDIAINNFVCFHA